MGTNRFGGGVEDREAAEQAIKREIFEEVGYKISTADELTPLLTFNFSSSHMSATVTVFTAKYSGIKNFSDSDETFVKDLQLFTLEKAKQLNLLPMRSIVLAKIKSAA